LSDIEISSAYKFISKMEEKGKDEKFSNQINSFSQSLATSLNFQHKAYENGEYSSYCNYIISKY
jgi:hypothetical protein